MTLVLTAALAVLCLQCVVVGGACEKEADLNFDSCDLKHLNDDVLTDICNRIGLDMTSHVLPYLLDEEESKGGESVEGGESASTTSYTHEDFVRGAEECLLIEDEMNRLESEDPDYLAQLEREALVDEPDIVAEIVADVLKQDNILLKEIATKLTSDVPELVNDMSSMLGEGEKLENRPDIVGLIVAQLLSDDQNLDILDEFDEALSGRYFREDDWGEDPESIGSMGNDEL